MNAGNARILVVDDTDAARYSVVRTLRFAGHEVIEAMTGNSALAMVERDKPDLVVLDVHLPDILGFEVAERLRANEATRSIAILQVSASFTGAEAQVQGLERGADAYLTHPVEPQVLVATVRALLRMRRAEQEAQSERARAERALAIAEAERSHAETSESRYRFLADMVPQLVWAADAEGNPDYFNQRWYEFAGGGSERSQTVAWSESIHPEDRAGFLTAWRHSLDTGQPLEIECRRWSPPAKAYRWLLVRGMPMKDKNGVVIRWFGTSTDIEAHKQALAERERLLAEARTATAERDKLVAELREEALRKNDFLAILSHELRNPLAPIINSVFILERANRDGEQAKRAREVIGRQVQHMTRLIDDLLDVTRIARGKTHLKREQVVLNDLVRRSVEDHRSLFKSADIEISVIGLDQPFVVDGDPTRLSQVIGNLLQNAAKFTPAGGRVVVLLSESSSNEVLLTVRDTGAGISADTLKHLFEPFVQGDKTLDRSSGGLGLGLALAKGIVDLHGGSISAFSEGPGKGSEFSVRLPVAQRVEPMGPQVVERNPAVGPCRVLIIEDHSDAAESLRDALELSGHVVDVAQDGAAGIDMARANRPDAILCDIGLPLVDGYAVARLVREDPALRDVLLVALSGYALQEDVERSLEAGFDRHMAKPPRLDQLERLLSEAPRRAVAERGAAEV